MPGVAGKGSWAKVFAKTWTESATLSLTPFLFHEESAVFADTSIIAGIAGHFLLIFLWSSSWQPLSCNCTCLAH
jgi:hypothetical protein